MISHWIALPCRFPQEQYMQDLRDDIAEMKGEQLTVASYEVSSSTDVEYFEQ